MKALAPLTIVNGRLIRPEGEPQVGAIRCEGDRIVALGADIAPQPGDRVVDAKGALIALAKSLAREVARKNVTVNAVAPGMVETDMTRDAPLEEVLKMIPMKRVGTVEEVAGIVAFLLSPEAGYITRQVIGVNGGLA